MRLSSSSANCRSNSRSCICQKAPCAAAASAASAACCALGCSLVSGKLRNTNRRLLPSRRCSSLTIGQALRQDAHSKSPYSTSVTGAVAGPVTWSRSPTGGVRVPRSARSTYCISVVTVSPALKLAGFLSGRSLSAGELDRAAGDSGEQRCEPPHRARILQTQCAIDRDRAGTDHRNADRHNRQGQVVLISLVVIEEAVLDVHGGDRDEHHAGDQHRRQGRREAQRQQQATAELRQPGEQRVTPPRHESELFQEATSARQPVPAKPAEQLLRAVRRHGDRKSTRLNSSHQIISYAVFCLKKKKPIYISNSNDAN